MKNSAYFNKAKQLLTFGLVFISCIIPISCSQPSKGANQKNDQKIGVLLVNHGSRSATWREALMALETSTQQKILEGGIIAGTKTAHMEYTEPSIATRLKEFDSEGYTDIIIVPVFLTVSPHTFDDIPTIIGQKEDPQSMEVLKIEKIERYKPKANTYITPNLDFTDILKKNILRRAKEISKNPSSEGLVLIGYGDATYNKEWGILFDEVAGFVKAQAGIEAHAYGWCGHIAHYNPDSTANAINKVLTKKDVAVVIPVLVAHDEMFQIKIIGDGISRVKDSGQRVIYRPDAILPDAHVEEWVVQVSREFAAKVKNGEAL